MVRYGQYCPVAKATEILGDRWTLLIVRDMLTGTRHFNELERGLPGISRGLLAERLQRLEKAGVIEKSLYREQRQRTAYQLTPAGVELEGVIDALLNWGAQWAFAEPQPQDLNPLLLLWWMRGRVCVEKLPPQRVVVQIDFTGAVQVRYWLLLTHEDQSVCESDPGFGIDLLVTADIAALYQVWLGRLAFGVALEQRLIEIDAPPTLARAFPTWFFYSDAAPVVRRVQIQDEKHN